MIQHIVKWLWNDCEMIVKCKKWLSNDSRMIVERFSNDSRMILEWCLSSQFVKWLSNDLHVCNMIVKWFNTSWNDRELILKCKKMHSILFRESLDRTPPPFFWDSGIRTMLTSFQAIHLKQYWVQVHLLNSICEHFQFKNSNPKLFSFGFKEFRLPLLPFTCVHNFFRHV